MRQVTLIYPVTVRGLNAVWIRYLLIYAIQGAKRRPCYYWLDLYACLGEWRTVCLARSDWNWIDEASRGLLAGVLYYYYYYYSSLAYSTAIPPRDQCACAPAQARNHMECHRFSFGCRARHDLTWVSNDRVMNYMRSYGALMTTGSCIALEYTRIEFCACTSFL